MKKITILLLGLILLAGLAAQAAEISGPLRSEMAALADGEMLSALVMHQQQADIAGLNAALKAEHATLAERNRRVINALQDAANQTQPELAAFLDNLVASGQVKSYHLFWIANMFSVEATRQGLEAIAARPELAEIYLNYEIEDMQPVNTKPEESLLTGHEIGLARINATGAWAQGWTGAGRVVMNIDTGVDGNHAALSARFRGDVDGDGDVDESWFDPYTTQYPNPRDDGGHGTHTMGTICGRTAGGDTIGVAIDAQWIAAAAIDRGGGIPRTVADAILSFEWAVDPDLNPNTQDNPDAIGNSWGVTTGHGYPPCDETFWVVIDNCEAAGSAVIFSAGNEGPTPNSLRRPSDRGTTPYNCFSVGAVDGNNVNLPIASFSSRGPSNCGPNGEQVIKPEVVAPGVSVRSSVPGGGYQSWDGTSMASPHITGSIAVIRQVNPNLDVDAIKEILISTAYDLPANNPDGEENTYGNGIIDLYEACLVAQSGYGFVQGTVTNTGGNPISNALITVVGTPRFSRADLNGHYMIGLPASDTNYTIEASFFGYISDDTSVHIAADDTVTANFSLQLGPTGSVHGRVRTLIDSSFIAGAVVQVANTPLLPVTTNDTGYFEISAIPGNATYTIRASASGYGSDQDTIFIPVGGNPQIDFYLRAVESFEINNGGWEGEGAWEWGEPTSGPNSAYDGVNVWATVLGGDYDNNADDTLRTSFFTITDPSALFSFYQWYDFESSWDGGNVSISTDVGATWTLLEPQGGYPDDNISGLDGDPGFTGASGDWQEAVFDLSGYQGQLVQFMFRFGTDGSVVRPGWYIDAVVLSGGDSWNQGTPDINVTPMSMSVNLAPGDTTAIPISIQNTGDGLLVFDMRAIVLAGLRSGMPVNNQPDPETLVPDYSKYLTYDKSGDFLHVSYNGPKIADNGGANPPMILDAGGPDDFGYMWIDSNEPGGPTFQWVDISGIGTPLTFGDDENQGPFDLGFNVAFYDQEFNSIRICSNGWASFTSTVTTYGNTSIPTAGEPNNLLAGFWDDMDPRDGGSILFYTNNVDTAIVAWDGINRYAGDGTVSFEIIILASGDIIFQYNSVTGTLNSSTVGIENGTGSTGLQVVYNQDYLADGLAIRFVKPAFWMYVTPTNGLVFPNETTNGTVVFDARVVENGTYTGHIAIESNDPDEASISVPCTLRVEPVGVEETPGLPTSFRLAQNYPNPFNPSTQISFSLATPSEVSLGVYDLLGRQVKSLVAGKLPSGNYTVIWDGTDQAGKAVSSGIYFYTIHADKYSDSRKMVLMK